MKSFRMTHSLLATSSLGLCTLALSVGVSIAQPDFFTEDFNGTTLDPAWVEGGDAAGHIGLTGDGLYVMTDAFGSPGTKLTRFLDGTPGSFEHSITVQLDPFLTVGDPPDNTKTDFKFKTFGPDGFVEIVVNSFGNARVWHRNGVANAQGNLVQNVNIGYTDGDLLTLMLGYDQGSDTLDASYALNGGAPTTLFAGPGNGGAVGDIITSFVEVEMFKFGNTPADQTFAGIESWTLVPEPSTWALLGIGGLALLFRRRR